ncbi:tRNA threonylcarbamoyladenosine dehydratase [Pedobacter puniceum]|uniref:tRNA threonylcarbamoyladenosine dehydratase n=1 Tax=Pedobacter puniceum TaxID=2666136 RepID=A0A7K0FS62_9SPHI|nr:tRNA threonylcarbamoyladenosine dehydratase [Pedobacter puniceum]MRX48285.1 tRNA threonylcarbamoyladenosine dehydratase [Pedobacter puniceum]
MIEIPHWMSRTNLLLDNHQMQKLINANVLVVGLGGVGGICAEMIARAGVGKMTIVDADVVEASNRNRQIPALISTDNQPKAEVMAQRLRDINPDIDLTVINEYIKDERTEEILNEGNFDYAVDCIDTLSPKVFFIQTCLEKGIPLVSSMGAGGRLDPSKVRISDISASYNCTLARYVRKRLKKFGIRKGLKVVFSSELPDANKVILAPEGGPKKSLIGTVSWMPAIFGCTVASVVIRDLYNKA